jgi:hypothetical protein
LYNPDAAVKVLVKRVLKSKTRRDQASAEPRRADSRGPERRNPRSSKTHLTQNQVAELVAAYAAGEGVKVLATRFGVHRSTVRQYAKQAGVTPPGRGLEAADVSRAVELYRAGGTLAGIAEKLGSTGYLVRQGLVGAGVPIRTGGGYRSTDAQACPASAQEGATL